MNDRRQQDAPEPTSKTTLIKTRDAIDSTQVQDGADDMADQANESEQAFDDNHGIFDKI